MQTLLILDDDAHEYRKHIERQSCRDLEILTATTPSQAEEFAHRAEFILGQPSLVAAVLASAVRLRWVQSTFAGVEALCAEGLRRDYLLTGVKDVFGLLTSEYVLCYVLLHERNVLTSLQNQQNRIWKPLPYRSLQDIVIGIVGLGSIGRQIARTARHFGMKVLGMNRSSTPVEELDRLYGPAERTKFLSQLDYLVLALPETHETRKFISLEDLNCMKKNALLINVGRGSTVNQNDLVGALRSRTIRGAVLDVFEEEPLPPESPLWHLDGVIITPHTSAHSFPDRIATIFCQNYEKLRNGLEPDYRVDFGRGY